MATLQFIGPYLGRSRKIGALEAINLFPALVDRGQNVVMYGTPGLRPFVSIDGNIIRGAHVVGDYCYIVSRNKLVKMNTVGVITLISTLIESTSGLVDMEDNGTQLLITDGLKGYLYNSATSTFSKPALPGIPSSLTIIDGFFIISEKGTGRFYQSNFLDGATWDAANVATAEASPDLVTAVISTFSNLFIFGTKSLETWYGDPSATQSFVFIRNSGMTINIGCNAPNTIAKTGEVGSSLIWLAQTEQGAGFVVRSDGGAPVTISTPELEEQWSKYTNLNDATAFTYRIEGHLFYVLNFPTADKTWVYDLVTNTWHRRSSGSNGGRSIADVYVYFNDNRLVSDYRTGSLYVLDMDTYTENGEEIVRTLVMPHVGNAEKQTTFESLMLNMETGQLAKKDWNATPPKALLYISNDRGYTYGNQHEMSLGWEGEYTTRAIVRRLGYGFYKTFKVVISAPMKIVIIYAALITE